MVICPKCKFELPDEAKFCSNCSAPIVRGASNSLVGKKINNKYIVLKKIAEGGMGEVYLARQESLGQEVAIKKLHASLCKNQNLVDRFITEARAYGKISHPNAVKVHDLLNVNGELCIIMEYVKGRTLTSYIESGYNFSQRQIVDIGMQIADALATVHQAGIIHRDLKTENIMLQETVAGKFAAKILDFGIAKVADAPTDGKTSEGQILGTPEFMSPEQCYGGALVDARSDIYSYGIILYAMLALRLPFSAETKLAVLGQQLTMQPPKLTRMDGQPVPHGLELLILKCLKKEPGERYQSFAEVISDLTQLQEGRDPAIAMAAPTPIALSDTIASEESLPSVRLGPIRPESSKESVIASGLVLDMGTDDESVTSLPGVGHEQGTSHRKTEIPAATETDTDGPDGKSSSPDTPDTIRAEERPAEEPPSPPDTERDRDSSTAGLRLGDEEEDDDELPAKEPSSIMPFVVMIFVLLVAAGAGVYWYLFLLPQQQHIDHLLPHDDSTAEPDPAPPVAENVIPSEPEPEPAAAAEQEEEIPPSLAVSRDNIMRGIYRTAFDQAKSYIYQGAFDQARTALDKIPARFAGATGEDTKSIEQLNQLYSDFVRMDEEARRAKNNLSCGNIKKLIASVPTEAAGFRQKLEKIQKSCSKTAEAPPLTL